MDHRYGCKYHEIKGDSLQFNLIFNVSFQMQCAAYRVQSQKPAIVPLSKYLQTALYRVYDCRNLT